MGKAAARTPGWGDRCRARAIFTFGQGETRMSTAAVTDRFTAGSPRFKARMAGGFYLLTFLTGAVALFVSSRLVVAGDAAATAAHLQAHELFFRLGFSA